MTADDLFKLPSDLRCELIDGVLIKMAPPGVEHGGIQATLAFLMSEHVRPSRLGRVVTESGFVLRREPDTVRAPDVAFIRAERIQPGRLPAKYWDLAPDLVVEVVSPSDTASEIQSKVREWVEAGVRLVWVVYPESRTMNVIRSLGDRVTLSTEDTLDGGSVVPGFSCRVAELFE